MRIINLFALTLSCCFLLKCIPDFNENNVKDKLYIKEIKTNGVKLEWFKYSMISNISSEYVLLIKENKSDTLCISDNIGDIFMIDKNIVISFIGEPTYNNKSIIIADKSFEIPVVIKKDFLLKNKKFDFYKKE